MNIKWIHLWASLIISTHHLLCQSWGSVDKRAGCHQALFLKSLSHTVYSKQSVAHLNEHISKCLMIIECLSCRTAELYSLVESHIFISTLFCSRAASRIAWQHAAFPFSTMKRDLSGALPWLENMLNFKSRTWMSRFLLCSPQKLESLYQIILQAHKSNSIKKYGANL